jgi:hypothetical protein
MISNLTMRLNWGDKSPRVNFYAQNCTYFCRLPKKIKSALSIDAREIWRERTFPRTFWYHGCRWEQLLYHFMLLFVFEIGENVKLFDNFLPFFPTWFAFSDDWWRLIPPIYRNNVHWDYIYRSSDLFLDVRSGENVVHRSYFDPHFTVFFDRSC